MTTIALVVGLMLAYLFGPGHGMNIDPSTLDAKALNTYSDNAHKLQGGGIGSFLLNIIPSTSFDALSRNDVLQVLFFAIIFGVSLALVGGEKGEKITSLIDAVSTVLFRAMRPRYQPSTRPAAISLAATAQVSSRSANRVVSMRPAVSAIARSISACACEGPRKGTGIRTFSTPRSRDADHSAAPSAEPSSPAAGCT